MAVTLKMVHLAINGKKVVVPSDFTVFQAAEKAGIPIPHYCYHPDLSIVGKCRMCLVEIEKNPKLQISCNTPVAEGMVIKTDSEKVQEAVKGVLELHLINHPLDCPICDKAGECKLQDIYRDFGLYESRMDYEKVHKPKVVDIGSIVLDSERCILCDRCVRFTTEITKTHELGIFNRGDRSELRTYDNKPLRNDYTGNLVDICPVGALTAKDFRFQQRVWFLEKTETVCGLCSRGCNTVVSVNPDTKKLYRIEPRRNPKVNKSWICDRGRWEYHYVHSESRIRFPREDGQTVTWQSAFETLHHLVTTAPGEHLVALSTALTNEELFDLTEAFQKVGVNQFARIAEEAELGKREPYDGILQHSDRSSNAQGFERVFKAQSMDFLTVGSVEPLIKEGKVKWIWLVGLEGKTPPGLEGWLPIIQQGVGVIVHSTSELAFLEVAKFVLPAATSFEKSGTVVNALDRLQKLQAVLPKQHTSRDGHQLATGLVQGHDRHPSPPDRGETVFNEKVTDNILRLSMKWKELNRFGVPLIPIVSSREENP